MSVSGVYVVQRMLSVGQAIPFAGVIPAVTKGALSLAEVIEGLALVVLGACFRSIKQTLAGRVFKEGMGHLTQGTCCFFYAGLSVTTFGFGGLLVETFFGGSKRY